jgi:putative SOS response-associated peptidase YedK
MPGLLLGPNNQSIFSAKWNPASRKKVLLTNNFAHILFANPVDGRHLLYGFLTTRPNGVIEPIYPKAMPVILTTPG